MQSSTVPRLSPFFSETNNKRTPSFFLVSRLYVFPQLNDTTLVPIAVNICDNLFICSGRTPGIIDYQRNMLCKLTQLSSGPMIRCLFLTLVRNTGRVFPHLSSAK